LANVGAERRFVTGDPRAADRDTPLLRARGLTFSHPLGNGAHIAGGVFDVSLDLFPGEIVAVLGPSGGGKSSLIRLLAGLTRADAGTLSLDDQPVAQFDARDYRRRVAMLFQQPHMMAGTVADNLRVPARLRGDDASRLDVEALLRSVDLEPELAAREAGTLSVGQQQRVALARLLAMTPACLLLDEPTAALDPVSTQTIVRLLQRLRADGVAILLVTHEIVVARRLADRVVVLVAGRVVEEGGVEQVLVAPQSEAARAFLAAEGEAP
jgi:ABC-type methionine transport system ATPase subunit